MLYIVFLHEKYTNCCIKEELEGNLRDGSNVKGSLEDKQFSYWEKLRLLISVRIV